MGIVPFFLIFFRAGEITAASAARGGRTAVRRCWYRLGRRRRSRSKLQALPGWWPGAPFHLRAPRRSGEARGVGVVNVAVQLAQQPLFPGSPDALNAAADIPKAPSRPLCVAQGGGIGGGDDNGPVCAAGGKTEAGTDARRCVQKAEGKLLPRFWSRGASARPGFGPGEGHGRSEQIELLELRVLRCRLFQRAASSITSAKFISTRSVMPNTISRLRRPISASMHSVRCPAAARAAPTPATREVFPVPLCRRPPHMQFPKSVSSFSPLQRLLF